MITAQEQKSNIQYHLVILFSGMYVY